MPMRRANKSKDKRDASYKGYPNYARWFTKNVRRSRVRSKIAKESRRRNR